MPRKAKRTISGDRALPARPPIGVPYGEGERALESQRRAPLPNRRASLTAVSGGGGGGNTATAAAAPQPGLQEAMAMLAPTSAIATPTDRPQEPITTGLTPNGASRPVIQGNEAYHELQALARQYPYPDLLRVLARVEAEM